MKYFNKIIRRKFASTSLAILRSGRSLRSELSALASKSVSRLALSFSHAGPSRRSESESEACEKTCETSCGCESSTCISSSSPSPNTLVVSTTWSAPDYA